MLECVYVCVCIISYSCDKIKVNLRFSFKPFNVARTQQRSGVSSRQHQTSTTAAVRNMLAPPISQLTARPTAEAISAVEEIFFGKLYPKAKNKLWSAKLTSGAPVVFKVRANRGR